MYGPQRDECNDGEVRLVPVGRRERPTAKHYVSGVCSCVDFEVVRKASVEWEVRGRRAGPNATGRLFLEDGREDVSVKPSGQRCPATTHAHLAYMLVSTPSECSGKQHSRERTNADSSGSGSA